MKTATAQLYWLQCYVVYTNVHIYSIYTYIHTVIHKHAHTYMEPGLLSSKRTIFFIFACLEGLDVQALGRSAMRV